MWQPRVNIAVPEEIKKDGWEVTANKHGYGPPMNQSQFLALRSRSRSLSSKLSRIINLGGKFYTQKYPRDDVACMTNTWQ